MLYFFLRNSITSNFKRYNIHQCLKCLRFSSSEKHNDNFSSKYKVFKDEESEVIFDVEEERLRKRSQIADKPLCFQDVFIERNKFGVFLIEELVSLVKSHNANNIFVLKLPPELNYVDYMVIISGTSRRHLNGVAELIKKEFKSRRTKGEIVPRIEGADSDWIAMDLGNIVIHVMLDSVRKTYDLESLWAIGAKYDLKSNMEHSNEILQLLKQHSINLDDLQPKT